MIRPLARTFRRGLATQPHAHLPKFKSRIVPKLAFFNSVTADGQEIPTYRVLDVSGKLIDGAELPDVSLIHRIQWSP
jgi:2-oxoisovalerate dehydrogenase E1 component alpha subunit